MNERDLATLFAAAAGLPALLFAILYPVLTRGAFARVKGGTGWLIWGLAAEVALFLSLAVSVRVFGQYPGRNQVALVLYGALIPLTWWLLISMLRTVWRNRKARG